MKILLYLLVIFSLTSVNAFENSLPIDLDKKKIILYLKMENETDQNQLNNKLLTKINEINLINDCDSLLLYLEDKKMLLNLI